MASRGAILSGFENGNMGLRITRSLFYYLFLVKENAASKSSKRQARITVQICTGNPFCPLGRSGQIINEASEINIFAQGAGIEVEGRGAWQGYVNIASNGLKCV